MTVRTKANILLGLIALIMNTAIYVGGRYLQPDYALDYLVVFWVGLIFSAIELGSRYKDNPWSVICSSPGFVYLFTNGAISVFGLFLIYTFKLGDQVSPELTQLAQRTLNVVYGSLGSFFIMRSSFLKLGGDNSQADIGLNIILKKLLEMIDREADRVCAHRRSEDITRILENISYSDVNNSLKPFCIQIMQNITPGERDSLLRELTLIDTTTECDNIKKLSAGLQIYNIVGRSVLESAVRNLKLHEPNRNGPEGTVISIAEEPSEEELFAELLARANPQT